MQSILQYRKFRRNLEQQIQRYGIAKVASVTSQPESGLTADIQNTRNSSSPTLIPDNQGNEEKRDDNQSTVPSLTTPSSTHERTAPSSLPSTYAAVTSSPQHHQNQPDEEKQEELTGPPPRAASSASSGTGYDTETDHQANDVLRATGTRLGVAMTGVSVRSRNAKEASTTKSHIFIVGYQGENDKLNPHNWPTPRRLAYTVLIAFIAFIVGLASSIDSAAIPQVIQEFGVSEVAESMATGIFLIGFGFGAFFAGPVSETVGRNPVYLVTGSLFMIFIMASALAPNLGTQLVFRFIGGVFGSTPLTCAGGSLSDLWNAQERTATFPIFAFAAFLGPVMGPTVGGWIAQSSVLSWRWCEWITLIWSGLIFLTVFLLLPETYAPVLLKWKAEHLRELTGDERYMSSLEAQDTKFWDRLIHNLYRPWLLLFFEPIVILFTIYLSVVYIILFTFLTGFEFIFEDTYGLSQGLTFTVFLALAIGILLGSAIVPIVVKRYTSELKKARAEGRDRLQPEQRLIFAMIGAPLLPLGLFWMAWTAYPSISIWSPITSNLIIGLSIITIFITTYQYLIDAFESSAASALVGLTFVRYVVAGAMIPVSIPFYRNLGVHWTLSILGALATILAPVPYVFYVFGARIRKKSKYAAAQA